MKGLNMARSKRKSIHYVNNAEFSQAVVEYVEKSNAAKANNEQIPIIPDYIAQCFLRIAEGLSHKSNFIRYTYREEMVMDAVENCLKAIGNYDLEAATRTGKPNAFAYFTQITWYAFLRRIAKEKKQQDVKLKYLTQSGIENFIDNELGDDMSNQVVGAFVDTLRDRIDKVKSQDADIKEYVKEEKRKKRTVTVDSDLSEFMT
jgi:predicted lipid-binding transport protein (Tim44 family)